MVPVPMVPPLHQYPCANLASIAMLTLPQSTVFYFTMWICTAPVRMRGAKMKPRRLAAYPESHESLDDFS